MVKDDTKDANIRYVGSNPNNYVLFNGEKWRIIGLMNNVKDEQGIEASRIKLIRNDSIGNYSWHNQRNPNWAESELQKVLNQGAYYQKNSGNCPGKLGEENINCDFSDTGLKEEAKQMITKVEWNLGGIAKEELMSILVNQFYEKERGDEVWQNNPTTWDGEVGLLYPSDYGYATSGDTNITREECLKQNSYRWQNSVCSNNSWLLKEEYWTLMPIIDSDLYNIVNIFPQGFLANRFGMSLYPVYPVVFLDTNVKITSGTGTDGNPYKITIES